MNSDNIESSNRDSHGLIRTNNSYLPDIVVEGSCSTLKLTLDNISLNIQSIRTNYKYLEQITPAICTAEDGIMFRNNVHTTLHSTKTLIEDTRGILQQVNSVFDRQEPKQKLKIFKLENNFKDAVLEFNSAQKELVMKFRTFVPPKTSGLIVKPAALEYMKTPYGNLQTLYVYQQKVLKHVEVDQETLLNQENALCQSENDIYDVNDILIDVSMMINSHRPIIEQIQRNLEEAARRLTIEEENARRRSKRHKLYRRVLLTLAIVSVGIIVSGCAIALLFY